MVLAARLSYKEIAGRYGARTYRLCCMYGVGGYQKRNGIICGKNGKYMGGSTDNG